MKFNPYLEVILAAIIWGSTGAFVKYIGLPPTTFSFFRLAVPTLILIIFFHFKKTPLFQGNNKLMYSASFLNAARTLLFYIAFTLTSISNAVIVLYTWPIFATISGMIFLKEKVEKRNIFLFGLAFLGIIFVYLNKEISFANKDFLGMTAMIGSTLIYSFVVTIFKKESPKYTKFQSVFYQNLIGAVLFLPFLFINRPFPTPAQAGITSFYVVLIGVIGFGLFFSALKRIKLSTASSLCYIEVISAILFGVIIFKETLTWNMVLGGVLIVLSTVLLKKDKTPSSQDNPTQTI